ncbi:MAG: GAF domain-containing protein, partial [Microcystaceae cyanobacterium]
MTDQKQVDSLEVLLHRMMNRIRKSLDLSAILSGTVAEVRAFLGTDRVKVYRFHADGSGEVVAESVQNQRLPPLLGQHFPAEDIPLTIRELLLKTRQRTIVDVATRQTGLSPLDCPETGESLDAEEIRFRTVDPCHADYLTAMGVQSSVVVPILHRDQLWGLLVSHHSLPRQTTERELQVVQLVADQVSIAIAHSTLLEGTRVQAQQEATINRVAKLLHSMTEMQLQQALEQTVSALQGSGGRVYIAPQNPTQTAQLFTCGQQIKGKRQKRMRNSPIFPNEFGKLSHGGSYRGESHSPHEPCEYKTHSRQAKSKKLTFIPHLLEEYPAWQAWLDREALIDEGGEVWAIADLYQASLPSDIAAAFSPTQIRGLLLIKLQYRQQFLGYLSIFREAIDIEILWAGRPDRGDLRNLRPRQSFETWRELKQGQAREWTRGEIELAVALGSHFAMAIHQYELYQQVHALNADLERDIEERKQAEIKICALNAELEQRVQERTAQLQRINAKLVGEISDRKQARASLERLSHQNELILNSAGEGIYGLNRQGRITFVNPAAARMLGYEVEELRNQLMHTVLNHSRSDATPYLPEESPIHATLQNGAVHQVTDDIFGRRDGSSFPVEYVSTPIRERGKIVGAVVIFKNITERKIV